MVLWVVVCAGNYVSVNEKSRIKKAKEFYPLANSTMKKLIFNS